MFIQDSLYKYKAPRLRDGASFPRSLRRGAGSSDSLLGLSELGAIVKGKEGDWGEELGETLRRSEWRGARRRGRCSKRPAQLCRLSKATSQENSQGRTSGARCTAEAWSAAEAESRACVLGLGCSRRSGAVGGGQRCSPGRCMLLPAGFSTIFRLPRWIPIASGRVLTQFRSSSGSRTRGWAHARHLRLPPRSRSSVWGGDAGLKGRGTNTMAAQPH